MGRSKLTYFVYLIIGFAVVGLVSQLFRNTANFIVNILVSLGIGAAIFAVIYFVFFRKRSSSNDMKKYKKAVRQSKAKYKQDKTATHTTIANKNHPDPQKKKRNKRASHLRVIDGNKSKRKDRASF